MPNRLLLTVFALSLWALPARAGDASGGLHVKADLLAEETSVRPGRPFWVAVRLRMQPGWHTYWNNPGDSGLPTKIAWALPQGFRADPFLWPAPERIEAPPLVSYGYDEEVLFLTQIHPPSGLAAGWNAELAARVDWLECADVCIPGKENVRVSLPVRDAPPESDARWTQAFANARARLPLADADWTIRAVYAGETIRVTLVPPTWFQGRLSSAAFIPEAPELIENAAPQPFRAGEKEYELELTAVSSTTARLTGVLLSPEGWRGPGSETALSVDVPVGGGAASSGGLGFWTALVFAFAGGLLLNLMPCVLPVLSLKVLQFVKDAGEGRAARNGAAFTAGVLVSFWILAGALLALRAGGRQLGWGFQLQSPAFVALLACLFFLLALNLLGVFEVGASLMGAAGGATRRGGASGAFLGGVLATVVATPCTAPFMGAALGFALTQPAAAAVLLFTALGLGMASPYLVFSLSPGLLRRVPRPGPWMESFKQSLGFLFLGTVVWLAWVLAQQVPALGIVRLLAAFVLLGMAAWIWGRWTAPVRSAGVRGTAMLLSAGVGAAGVFLAARPSGATVPASVEAGQVGALAWEPFSPARVEELRRGGRKVLVDFTAAWCLTCQVNERVALAAAPVMARLKELDVALVRADWTNRDDVITEALRRLGRSGVPVYALYVPGEAEPRLLPSVLTPGLVLDALKDIRPKEES